MIRGEFKKFIIIHGEKPLRNCRPNQEFLRILEKGVEIFNEHDIDGIVVSGGVTRKNCIAESVFGRSYLESKVSGLIITEEKSHTTIQNIKFAKELLKKYPIEKLVVVVNQRKLLRYRYIYGRLWKDLKGKIEFIVTPSSFRFWPYLYEFLCLTYALLDIDEKFLPRLSTKIFRNS